MPRHLKSTAVTPESGTPQTAQLAASVSGAEGKDIHLKPGIAGDEGQHVVSAGSSATRRIIPARSKRATPSGPTSAPRASPIGLSSSITATAAFPDGPDASPG